MHRITYLLLPIALTACTSGRLSGGREAKAFDLLTSALDGGDLMRACRQLSKACQSKSGELACLAENLFCGATLQQTCAKLAKTCSLGIGCSVYATYCKGVGPDAGPDGPPITDVGPDGPQAPDLTGGCTPDDPNTPLVNEDTCPSGQQCVGGKCVFVTDASVAPDAPGSGCTPDDPKTPLVNEDTCPSPQQCVGGKCVLVTDGSVPTDGPGSGCTPDDPNTPLVNEETCPSPQHCVGGICVSPAPDASIAPDGPA